jgi:hypothetical protein
MRKIRFSFLSIILSLFTLAFAPSGFAANDGSIGGYKFNDLNGNGVDNDEPRLSGFTIHLSNVGGVSVHLMAVTDAEGEFAFEGLPAQTYLVCEVAPVVSPPWVPTRPECVRVRLHSHTRFLGLESRRSSARPGFGARNNGFGIEQLHRCSA